MTYEAHESSDTTGSFLINAIPKIGHFLCHLQPSTTSVISVLGSVMKYLCVKFLVCLKKQKHPETKNEKTFLNISVLPSPLRA